MGVTFKTSSGWIPLNYCILRKWSNFKFHTELTPEIKQFSTNLGIKVASTLTNSVKESEKQDFFGQTNFFC